MIYALVGFGRTGREIDRQARRRGHDRKLIIDPAYRGRGGRRMIKAGDLVDVDVAFEFTEPAAAGENVQALLDMGVSVVCGTTGWNPGAEVRKAAEASGAGIVFAPNFSVGMNIFYGVIKQAARRIGALGLHDPYVIERHHRGKIDSPSGTAAFLAAMIRRNDPRHPGIVHGNQEGKVPTGSVHVASVRAGHEHGKHTVGFDGEFDSIEMTHTSRGRTGLATGAVLAAEWIAGRTGMFGFDHVLSDLLKKGKPRGLTPGSS